MKHKIAIVLGILMFYTVPVGGEDSCNICSKESDAYARIKCLYEYAFDNTLDGKKAICIMNCLKTEWLNRDGAGPYHISDAFLVIMEKRPNEFFDFMSKNYTLFGEWEADLDKYSFVWFKDEPSPLEGKRKHLIEFLKSSAEQGDSFKDLKIELIKVLVRIKPRQVQ